MSTSSGLGLVPPVEKPERNWLPLALAAGVVIVVAVVAGLVLQHGHQPAQAASPTAPTDPYAVNLPISNLVMSESANLAGGKVTYIDGQITNTGQKTVTAVSVQVLFRNVAQEVAQNDPPQPLKLIRTRQPYIDTEPLSAEPLKPGDRRDFRLAFDSVSPDWDGAYPQLRVLRVTAH